MPVLVPILESNHCCASFRLSSSSGSTLPLLPNNTRWRQGAAGAPALCSCEPPGPGAVAHLPNGKECQEGCLLLIRQNGEVNLVMSIFTFPVSSVVSINTFFFGKSINKMIVFLSNQMVSAEPADSGRSKLVVPVEPQAQQQVLVALRGAGGEGGAQESSAEVMEVSVFGLPNNSVAFICEEKRPQSGVLTTAESSTSSTSSAN